MIKAFLTSVLALYLLTPAPTKRITVLNHIKAMKLHPAYHTKDEDSIFVFKGTKYLVTTQGNYTENGELDDVLVYGDLDYVNYSHNELLRFYNSLLKEYGFLNQIEVAIINKNLITLNKKNIRVEFIDNDSKTIFYFLKGNKKNIYLIKFK